MLLTNVGKVMTHHFLLPLKINSQVIGQLSPMPPLSLTRTHKLKHCCVLHLVCSLSKLHSQLKDRLQVAFLPFLVPFTLSSSAFFLPSLPFSISVSHVCHNDIQRRPSLILWLCCQILQLHHCLPTFFSPDVPTQSCHMNSGTPSSSPPVMSQICSFELVLNWIIFNIINYFKVAIVIYFIQMNYQCFRLGLLGFFHICQLFQPLFLNSNLNSLFFLFLPSYFNQFSISFI